MAERFRYPPIVIGLPVAALLIALVADLFAQIWIGVMLGFVLFLGGVLALAVYGLDQIREPLGLTWELSDVREPLAAALAAAMILFAGAFLSNLAPGGSQLGRIGLIAGFQERLAIQAEFQGVFWDARTIADALAAADARALEAAAQAVPLATIRAAFAYRVADGRPALEAYFEAARERPEALDWLDGRIAAGLDPSAPFEIGGGRRTAPLWAAVDAGNDEAAIRLLAAGANPHAYESFTGSTGARPRFGWPVEHVLEGAPLADEARVALAEAMVDRGGVLSEPLPEALDGKIETPSPTICEGQHLDLCRAASERDRRDWCRFIDDNTLSLSGPIGRFGARTFQPEHLLAILDGQAYLRGSDPTGDEPVPMMLRIAPERRWMLYFRAEDSCRDPETGRFTIDCWLGFELQRDPRTGRLTEIHPEFGLSARPLQTRRACP